MAGNFYYREALEMENKITRKGLECSVQNKFSSRTGLYMLSMFGAPLLKTIINNERARWKRESHFTPHEIHTKFGWRTSKSQGTRGSYAYEVRWLSPWQTSAQTACKLDAVFPCALISACMPPSPWLSPPV